MSARPTQTAKELYEFGPFQVDPETETLVRDGEPVPLTPKTFQILLVLVRPRPGGSHCVAPAWPPPQPRL